jgi:hypothetical protein
MRVHKARGAAYDLDKERQWNWFRPGKGERRSGPVHHLTVAELRDFAEREGMEVSTRVTAAEVRHS